MSALHHTRIETASPGARSSSFKFAKSGRSPRGLHHINPRFPVARSFQHSRRHHRFASAPAARRGPRDRSHPTRFWRRACAAVFLPASFSFSDPSGASRNDSFVLPSVYLTSQQMPLVLNCNRGGSESAATRRPRANRISWTQLTKGVPRRRQTFLDRHRPFSRRNFRHRRGPPAPGLRSPSRSGRLKACH